MEAPASYLIYAYLPGFAFYAPPTFVCKERNDRSQSSFGQGYLHSPSLCFQRRRRYGLDDYRLSTPSNAPVPTAVDERQDHSQQLSSPATVASSQQQQARKSLSTLHKERKLKELSETANTTEAPTKADILKQQAFQSVLTDIFAGNGSSVSPTPVRPVEISPESGYNSSTSLKSPSSAGNTALAANQRQILQQQQQSKPAKPNEVELSASRERILEQVRSRRASAPPVQHLGSSALSNRPSTISPQPQNTSGEQQRPLKSILKKRQPSDSVFSRSIDYGLYQNDHQQNGSNLGYRNGSAFAIRSSSYSDEGDSKRSSVMSNDQRESSVSSAAEDSRMMEKMTESTKKISLSSETTSSTIRRPSPVPVMAAHPGPSDASVPDSPGPYLHHVDYPSPVRNGGSSASSGKHGDLPDVVVLKLGANGKPLQSPQSSFEDAETVRVAAVPSPKFQATSPQPKLQHLEKPKSLGERPKSSSREEDTAAAAAESHAFREWDPRPLLKALYTVRYEARPEEKRQRFVNMEGHLEHLPMNMRAVVASDTLWRTHYFRMKEGRLQWFEVRTGSVVLV